MVMFPVHQVWPKPILQGTVKGGRRQGGQRKRWEDNIREWTGLEFTKSQRAVENREKWRKRVAKSSVVPQRPSRLRDWWWWWYWIFPTMVEFLQNISMYLNKQTKKSPPTNTYVHTHTHEGPPSTKLDIIWQTPYNLSKVNLPEGFSRTSGTSA